MAGILSEQGLCYACRHFSLLNSGDSVFTSVEGFRNWKKATYKDGGFAAHTKSESHINAMLAWTEYNRSATTSSSLLSSLSNEYDKLVKANREYIKTVADVLLLTATQRPLDLKSLNTMKLLKERCQNSTMQHTQVTRHKIKFWIFLPKWSVHL